MKHAAAQASAAQAAPSAACSRCGGPLLSKDGAITLAREFLSRSASKDPTAASAESLAWARASAEVLLEYLEGFCSSSCRQGIARPQHRQPPRHCGGDVCWRGAGKVCECACSGCSGAREAVEQGVADAVVREAVAVVAEREPPGSLLSVRAIRNAVTLEKASFDAAVLRAARAGLVVLHHHDFPQSLPPEQREQLVHDAGTYYVGLALPEAVR